MLLSIADAAHKVGITRQTLYKLQKAGKISFEQDYKGRHNVDTAELFRCFPPVPEVTTPVTDRYLHLEDDNRRLRDQVAEYREREQQHLAHINQLTRLLEHLPGGQPADPPAATPPRRGFWGRIFGGDK